MGNLLVSIKNLHEARIVVDADISVLDVKEPSAGPLGRANWDTIRQIGELRTRAGAKPSSWSLACGELVDWNPQDEKEMNKSLKGFDLVKIGLSSLRGQKDWRERLFGFWDTLPLHIQPVIVAYVDFEVCNAPSVKTILRTLAEISMEYGNSPEYCLFDTYSKRKGHNLFSFATMSQISGWIETLRELEIKSCLAGSIGERTLKKALKLNPDLIGVRSAVCVPNRQGTVNRSRLDSLCELIRQNSRAKALKLIDSSRLC